MLTPKQPHISVAQLSKTFVGYGSQKKNVLNNISFDLSKSSINLLLGHNGAGKTTLLKMILGLLKQNSGEITVLGEALCPEVLRNIGFMPEEEAFHMDLTVLEALKYQMIYYGQSPSRAKVLLEEVGLGAYEKNPIRTLSKGLKRRLAWLYASGHSPSILLLDEPLSGLDYPSKKSLLNRILLAKQQGCTLLISTHSVRDFFEVADRVLILDQGVLQLNEPREYFTQVDEIEHKLEKGGLDELAS